MRTASDVFLATCDLASQVRGRSVPSANHDAVLRGGVGWVPANLGLTAFGDITSGDVFGSIGDLRMLPDRETGLELPADGDHPGLRMYLTDLTHPDGTAWPCCPRGFLRETLDKLADEAGLRVRASFEHEFVLRGLPSSAPFSLRRHRDAARFGEDLLETLTASGLDPETWLPEYGEDQFEVTLCPTEGLRAADRAVYLRELVRDLALRRSMSASFAPLQHPDGTGSGVHLHFSLTDKTGEPVLFDPAKPGRLSTLGLRFSAGILRHARALTAWTAPSPVSFLRLRPHRWSVRGAFLAEHNREALLRICPTSTVVDTDPARQFNLEFRAADATANPWLTLAVVLRAGLAGLAGGADYPEPVVWPEEATEQDLANTPTLPGSLPEALADLEADDTVRSWFDPRLLASQLAVKRHEMDHLAGLADTERVRRVADAY
ncbi:glutamine synthetase [Tamaricihabitans halophyticus]|uniref:Glutamine synthetase n=1 Tax=Tamaricihabitans halophyticus TaxID=1262583 RepID=A0A4R2QXV0_9PSEU|nr:glutamine synthetase family protein [Tamaricihabitans halophyticus]TCP55040.1 glutamine synthetase [Tamaricihabitans halophyticus]